MAFASPSKLDMKVNEISKVVSDNGTTLIGGVAEMLLIRKPHISFKKSVYSIIAALFERVHQMDVDILIQINSDA